MNLVFQAARTTAASAFALCIFQQQAFAAATMHVAVDTHNIAAEKSDGGKNRMDPDSKSEYDVSLGDGFISIKSGDADEIFDFTLRRRYSVDLKSKTYVEYSLYDVIGFRSMEFANRRNLGRMLATAGADAGSLSSKVENEHEFSVADKDPSIIDIDDKADEVIGKSGNWELERWSKKGSKAAPGEIAHFVQFLRYFQGGHPRVLARLASQDTIPDLLVETLQSPFGTSVHSLHISAVETGAVPAYDLRPFARRRLAQQAGGFDDLLDHAESLTPAETRAAADTLAAQRDKDVQDGGMLAVTFDIVEWGIATGRQPKPIPQEKQAMFHQDAAVQEFVKFTSASSKDELNVAADGFAALRAKYPQRTPLLALLEANNRLKLGDTKTAYKLYRQSLEGNPELAGAYKDIGDFLYMQFDTPEAWRSWDIGRRIAPEFPNFKPIRDYEAGLAAQYPEYFKYATAAVE